MCPGGVCPHHMLLAAVHGAAASTTTEVSLPPFACLHHHASFRPVRTSLENWCAASVERAVDAAAALLLHHVRTHTQ